MTLFQPEGCNFPPSEPKTLPLADVLPKLTTRKHVNTNSGFYRRLNYDLITTVDSLALLIANELNIPGPLSCALLCCRAFRSNHSCSHRHDSFFSFMVQFLYLMCFPPPVNWGSKGREVYQIRLGWKPRPSSCLSELAVMCVSVPL